MAGILDGRTGKRDPGFTVFDTEGDVVNRKRTDRVRDLDIDFDLEQRKLLVERVDGECRQFDLETDRRAATDGSVTFRTDVTLRRDESVGELVEGDLANGVVVRAVEEDAVSPADVVRVRLDQAFGRRSPTGFGSQTSSG